MTSLPSGLIRHCARLVIATLFLAGCFYPAMGTPPPVEKTQITVDTPYDLTWDAAIAVIKNNNYHLQAQDPVHGVLEVQSNHFSLADVDCGIISSVGGKYPVEPDPGASAVYNFVVKPNGRESSTVAVQATFDVSLRVPFHRVSDTVCISRGVQEARLLNEVAEQAKNEHRPYQSGKVTMPVQPLNYSGITK
ncbi:MAG TPA: hypothetical protein VGI47_09090 [Candidatus Binataceae bacterium]|jgi:hypothetical protein